MPRPLLSEALRGHGALLRDADGERFVDELLPRDVVARAMTARMLEQGVDHLWLDATGLERFDERFPTIAAALGEVGLDPATDWLPIAPAAHYTSAASSPTSTAPPTLPGLWAAGEVACTGVHGANRLASNSLLEGMVFAARVVEAIERGKDGPEPTGAMRAVLGARLTVGRRRRSPTALRRPATHARVARRRTDVAELRVGLQRAMTATPACCATPPRSAGGDASIERAAPGRRRSTPDARAPQPGRPSAPPWWPRPPAREESRGAHTRADFPGRRPSPTAHRLVRVG